jgi:hypothetical protein
MDIATFATHGGKETVKEEVTYLKEVDARGVKTIIFYCDNCTGLNKNRVILSIKYFLQTSENLQTIQINYLLPGHTYMPVDSMHAVIELLSRVVSGTK